MSQDNEQQQERRRLKNQTKAIYQATRRANPVTRSLEQSSDTARKRIAREEPGVREQRREHEQPADTVRRAVAREEPGVQEQRREQEQPASTVRRAVARQEPGVQEQRREQEQPADTVRRAVARQDPAVRARESRQRAVAQGKKIYLMACKYIDGDYLFHRPCGLWNEPCVHGCGYIHLSNSSPGTRKKCCVNGRLSSASENFDEGLMLGYVLDELPAFVRKVISNSNKFSQKSSTYNNLVAMAATVVCNYNETAGFILLTE